MELIETELSEFTRRSRSLVVSHHGAGLARGLEYGERVLVRDGDSFRIAVVADIDFEVSDTCYRLVLGGRILAEDSARLLDQTSSASADPGRVSVHDVADLLALSGAVHRIPIQRQVARRLLDR